MRGNDPRLHLVADRFSWVVFDDDDDNDDDDNDDDDDDVGMAEHEEDCTHGNEEDEEGD